MDMECNWCPGRESPQDTWPVSIVPFFALFLVLWQLSLGADARPAFVLLSLFQRRGWGIVLMIYRSGILHKGSEC